MVTKNAPYLNWQTDTFTVANDGSITSEGGIRNNNHGYAESCEFLITAKFLVFNLCINAWDSATGMTVLIDGKKEFFLTNFIMNCTLKEYILNVSDFIGKKAKIKLTDAGTWESITLKNILFTDDIDADKEIIEPISNSVMLDYSLPIEDGKYINVPIQIGQDAGLCEFHFDGKNEFNLFLRLAKFGKTDFIAAIPIEEFESNTVRIYSEDIFTSKSVAEHFFEQISVSEEPVGYENFYMEESRPKLHFTTSHGGIGDMIGFYYYKGKYNIGYLYDPGFDCWNDNSSWGFSESENLFKWQFKGIRIRKGHNTKRSSGCGFVDTKNATDLKSGENDPILLFYSVERQDGQRMQDFHPDRETQEYLSKVSIKYSTDGGKTFEDYSGNPIFLTSGVGGHDPEVIYYEPENKYVLVIHDKRNNKWGFDFYESKNLLNWSYMSTFEGMWETPNFYPLQFNGKTYWVLQQCDSSYMIGDFDGREFIPYTKLLKNFDGGAAMRSFNADGRRILMASCGFRFCSKDYNGNGISTLPMELSLKNTTDGLGLCYTPAKEIKDLRIDTKTFTEITAEEFNRSKIKSGLLDIEIEADTDFSLMCGNTEILSYNNENNKLKKFRIITDETVISFFEEDGIRARIAYFENYHINGQDNLQIKATGQIKKITINFLKSPYTI